MNQQITISILVGVITGVFTGFLSSYIREIIKKTFNQKICAISIKVSLDEERKNLLTIQMLHGLFEVCDAYMKAREVSIRNKNNLEKIDKILSDFILSNINDESTQDMIDKINKMEDSIVSYFHKMIERNLSIAMKADWILSNKEIAVFSLNTVEDLIQYKSNYIQILLMLEVLFKYARCNKKYLEEIKESSKRLIENFANFYIKSNFLSKKMKFYINKSYFFLFLENIFHTDNI